MTLTEQFEAAFPKAIDFPKSQYDAQPAAFLGAAAANGYRLAGVRLQRAVFTTKKLNEENA